MRNIAIIDCGTNTFHLLIVKLQGADPMVLHQEKRVVKIGEGGINNKKITKEAQQRAIDALQHFKIKIDELRVDKVYAFATSAFRNASNGLQLKKQILKETNIDLSIIDGGKEAELIYRGVFSAMEVGTEPVLTIDIGGGSVEFIIATGTEILWKKSFEIGAQRLMDLFHKHDPILETEVDALESYLGDTLGALFEASERFQPNTLIGSSGTFDTLSAIYCQVASLVITEEQTETPLTIPAYHRIHEQLITKGRAGRLAIPGMIEMRVDMIVVASCLVDFLLKRISFQRIRVSKYALKEGVLAQIVDGAGLD
ncbi:MAG: exopolyphosphatase [Bacteroidota bacterium]